jgi:hypothetical protein
MMSATSKVATLLLPDATAFDALLRNAEDESNRPMVEHIELS